MSRIMIAMLIGLAVAMGPVAADEPAGESGVVHVVLVWLKEPGNVEHRQRIIDGSKRLAEIPVVRDLRVGRVLPGERDVVMDDYDVGLYLRFDSRADLEAYLGHPVHQKTVKNEFKPIMERFRVIDFRDE